MAQGEGRFPICGKCGVDAPTQARACGACGEALPTPRVTAPCGGEAYWVAVRATFVCRGCGFPAPLEELPADGAVECASCGLRQAFDVSAIGPMLSHAHAAGDLAGPNPEGRTPHPRLWIGDSNAYREVGASMAFAEHLDEGTDGATGVRRSIRVEAGPGHPVCATCAVPLDVAVDGGVATARCARCGDSARYALPAVRQHPELVGVVAADHSDKPRARSAQDAGGAIALACPSCGAPLTGTTRQRTATCNFCRTTVLVPARAVARQFDQAPKASVWWLMFKGPSQKRVELETLVRPMLENDPTTQVFAALKLKRADRSAGARAIPVDIAPEKPGIGVAQLVVSLVVMTVMLAVTYPIAANLHGHDVVKKPRSGTGVDKKSPRR